MPRYDFKCFDCQRSQEVAVATFAARQDHIICDSCGRIATRQFPTRTTFRLGPDRYEADYKSGHMDVPGQ